MTSYDTKITPINSKITRRILGPIVLSLAYFSQRGLTHRTIRPENIFWDGEEQNFVMLGDCVTGLPSVYQSMIIETIEFAMTPSYARGPGQTGKSDNAVKADENAGVVPATGGAQI